MVKGALGGLNAGTFIKEKDHQIGGGEIKERAEEAQVEAEPDTLAEGSATFLLSVFNPGRLSPAPASRWSRRLRRLLWIDL